jgi:hypothetical protein
VGRERTKHEPWSVCHLQRHRARSAAYAYAYACRSCWRVDAIMLLCRSRCGTGLYMLTLSYASRPTRQQRSESGASCARASGRVHGSPESRTSQHAGCAVQMSHWSISQVWLQCIRQIGEDTTTDGASARQDARARGISSRHILQSPRDSPGASRVTSHLRSASLEMPSCADVVCAYRRPHCQCRQRFSYRS